MGWETDCFDLWSWDAEWKRSTLPFLQPPTITFGFEGQNSKAKMSSGHSKSNYIYIKKIKTHKNEHTHISKQRFPCIRSFPTQKCIYSSLSYAYIRGKRQYAVHFLALFPFVENINYLCYLYVLSKCHWSQRLKPNHDTCTIEGTHGTHITFERFSSLVILIECLAQINRSFQIYSRRKITVKGKDLELTLKHIHLKKCFLDSR